DGVARAGPKMQGAERQLPLSRKSLRVPIPVRKATDPFAFQTIMPGCEMLALRSARFVAGSLVLSMWDFRSTTVTALPDEGSTIVTRLSTGWPRTPDTGVTPVGEPGSSKRTLLRASVLGT